MARGTNQDQHPKDNKINPSSSRSIWDWFGGSAGGGQGAGIINQPLTNTSGATNSPSDQLAKSVKTATNKIADAVDIGELKYIESTDKSKVKIRSFPLDLENSNLPYVIFYVYGTNTGTVSGAFDDRTKSLKEGAGEIFNVGGYVAQQADELTFNLAGAITQGGINIVDKIGQVGGELVAGEGNVGEKISSVLKKRFEGFSLQRNTTLLEESIVLFMPETLQADYAHNYDEISVTATLGAAGMLAQAISDKKGGAENATDPYILEAAGSIAGALPGLQSSQELTNLLVFGTTGRAINPQMEVLYNSPRLRTFTFDFRLVPRNAKDASRILSIINAFKYYSAPSIQANTSGRYYIPPSRFVMEFHHRGNENPYLFKTKQCVLENITLDYAPNGYASHYDGAPVETRMQLIFKETTMISREDINYSTRNIDFLGASF